MLFEVKNKNSFFLSAAQNSRLVRSVGTPNLKYLFASFQKGITRANVQFDIFFIKFVDSKKELGKLRYCPVLSCSARLGNPYL